MKTTTLQEVLRERPLLRYASLPQDQAARLAHQDFVSGQDHIGFLPNEALMDNYVCKMYATDFFRRAVEFTPELITPSLINDFERIFTECNAASRLNIVTILGLLKYNSSSRFLEAVITSPEKNGGSLMLIQAANEALLIFHGHLEIGSNNLLFGRQIYWLYPR